MRKRERQGYNDRLDESLGERHGAERKFKQTLKDRRDESKGMSKKSKGHAYESVKTMDKGRPSEQVLEQIRKIRKK